MPHAACAQSFKIAVENNATTLIWYVENRFDVLINRVTILNSQQDLC